MEIKKVEISMKNPVTYHDEIFQKKILKSQTFLKNEVHLYFYATLPHPAHTPQKKPQKPLAIPSVSDPDPSGFVLK